MHRIQCIETIVNCLKLFCSLKELKVRQEAGQIFQGQLPSFQLLECTAFFHTYNENGTILNIQGLRLRALNIRMFYFIYHFDCINKIKLLSIYFHSFINSNFYQLFENFKTNNAITKNRNLFYSCCPQKQSFNRVMSN